MWRVAYMENNTTILHKCEEVLKELSAVQSYLDESVKYFQGFVDDGIIPPEELEKNLLLLESVVLGIRELLEMLRDYMGNIEGAETNVEGIRKLVWQDKQIISILKHSINSPKDLRYVLADIMGAVNYWCAQKWLNGKHSFAIESSLESIMIRYYDLVWLLERLMQSIEEHCYWCSGLEKSITIPFDIDLLK